MAGAWEWDAAVNAVSNYYNTDAGNVWQTINEYNITSPEQLQTILPTVDSFLYGNGVNSGYTAIKYADGSVASWNNVTQIAQSSASAAEQALNSNAGSLTQNVYQLPANTTMSGGTGGNAFSASKGVTGGISGAVNVMSQVSAGVAAAGLGIKLGKAIDSALYNANPNFWDNAGLSSLNPETWNSITVDMSDTGWEGTAKRAFNAIFGLDPNTGKQQMYIDQNAAAYLAMYMQEQGVFATGEQTANWGSDVQNPPDLEEFNPPFKISGNIVTKMNNYPYPPAIYELPLASVYRNTLSDGYTWFVVVGESLNSVAGTLRRFNANTGVEGEPINYVADREFTYNGKTVYFTTWQGSGLFPIISGNPNLGFTAGTGNKGPYIAWILKYGTISGGSTIDGITDQDNATTPDFTGCTTPADYLQALQNQYPDMFQDSIQQNVVQPDGTVIQRVYIPVGTPTGSGTQDSKPTSDENTSGQSQDDTQVDTRSVTETVIKTLIDYITNTRVETPDGTKTDTPDNPPDTGDGNTPTVLPPTGNASALWTVYNPTQAQLNSFGAWLWSSNFIDQVLKLFNNPMQAIIGVHKIFATPTISGSGSIVVGYLDSGVSSNIVGAQYTTIDCGTVNVREQFGNIFDYEDTNIRLYLPFIGIVPLDTSDVMRGSVRVVYHVDVITGACLAEVKVTRDSGGGTLYQFAGDAAVRYPISSGSYMGVVSGVLGVVGGIASSIMSGGATLPMAAGAIASGMSQAKTQVQHSGSFAGNAGAMGGKKPYLIIERPQTAVASGYGNYQGKGANCVASVGDMSGYFKMTDVHTSSISGASDSEIEEIRTALERGVLK